MSLTDPPAYEAPEAQQEEYVVFVDTFLLPLYAKHVTRHVWEEKVYLFTFTYTNWVVIDVGIFIFSGDETVKFVNHFKKILNLEQNVDAWFQDIVCYYWLVGLCSIWYMTISHDMLKDF